MLAREYDPVLTPFPCLVQPKLDGVRMLASSECGLSSRTGKSFAHLAPLFREDLDKLPDGVTLDGELFARGLGFQAIVSLVRNEQPDDVRRKEGTALAYHVYDVMLEDAPFSDRHAYLRALFDRCRFSKRLALVETRGAKGARDVDAALDRYVRQGYEGVMVRDPASPYECGKRPRALQKYKRFQDGEFVIVGFVEAKGKDRGTVVFECATAASSVFRVRPMGTLAERRALLQRAPILIGKMLTVRYQGMTDGDNPVPRFPVAVAIRDYEG